MSTIRAGYRITVTSWENDADSYNTSTVDGLTKEEAAFHVDLLKLISSRSEFSNMYDPTESEIKKFEAAVAKVMKAHNQPEEEYPADFATDIICEYTGYSEFYTRVAETINVEYVPQEIVIDDVSAEFGI